MNKLFKKLFKQSEPIRKIEVKRSIIQKIIDITKETHPKEFLIFLEGKIDSGKIVIKDLIFQPYIANENSAMARLDIPLTTNIVGSIHSHPGPSNRPSRADRHFFRKVGLIHGIIRFPYEEKDIQFYDLHGEPIKIDIVL